MRKKHIGSVYLVIFGILLPEFITYLYNKFYSNDFRYTLQYITGALVLLSGFYLLIQQVKLMKVDKSHKITPIVLIVVGFIAILYSIFTLFLQLVTRNGIGF